MKDDRLHAKKALTGDKQAFMVLVESYHPGIYGFLVKMGIPKSKARDLACEVFARAYRSLYRYNWRWEFSTWLYKLASGMAIRFRRRNPGPLNLGPESRTSCPPGERPEEDFSLNDILDSIHIETRAMLILHYYNRIPLREIGRIFGLSVTSVRMRIDRAREFLAGEITGRKEVKSDPYDHLTARIKQEIPCENIPAGAILNLARKEPDRVPEFIRLVLNPNFMRKIWPIAIPAILGVILACLLFVRDVSEPFWGAIMTIFDSNEKPASIDFPTDGAGTSLTFTDVSGLLSGNELVAMLNDSGDAVWQVLHAGENLVVIRNGSVVACYRDGQFYRLIDLESFGLKESQASDPVFSMSPTGEFMLVGNSSSGESSGTGGVFLFNTSDGGYYRLSPSSMDRIVYAWSSSGSYLAFAEKDSVGSVFLLDLKSRLLEEMKTSSPVKSIYVSNNGGVGIFTGDTVMTAFTGDSSWRAEAFRHEPFYINPDSETVWYVSNGVIMKHILGSNDDTAINPATASANGGLTDTQITDYRLVGNYLVFRMKNGYTGLMNMRTAKISLFNTGRDIKSEQLPWCLPSPSGTRVMFDNEGSFLIVSESSVTMPQIPGYSSLSPRHTHWLDEENLAYVRMVDENDPMAGELSVYVINVLTGEITEVYRSVDKEPVLNAGNSGSSGYTPPSQNTSSETVTIHETDKATGSKAETYVTKTCKVKNGPGDGYDDIGEIRENEIIIYNTRPVNGWYLAQKVSGMISYYDTRNRFWIRGENIHLYDRYSLPAGVITDDKVKLSKTTLSKGNLIRVIVPGEQKSYVIAESPDMNFGITGWISNESFTTSLSGAYVNQAYIKSGSTVYSRPGPQSEPVADFTDFVAKAGKNVFVNLAGNSENGFVQVKHANGMSGWVREQDIQIPGTSTPGGSAPSDSPQPAGTDQIDINGDGIADRISFTTDGKKYTLTVNQSRAEGRGSGIQPQYKIVDVDMTDKYYEIVIEEHGSGGEYMSTFYYYDGRSLVLMGKVQGLCGNTDAVRGDGTVRSRTRGSVLENWYFIKEYRLNSQHRLVETPSAFYEKIGHSSAGLLRLKIDSLSFSVSPGSNEISFVLARDETVRFIGSDNQRWCLFQTPDGRNGWLEVKNQYYIADTGLAAWEVFDGLNLAD